MASCRNNDGFTLIELAITCVLAGILAAVAIPNILSWLPEMRLKRAARDLYSNIVNIRMNAVKENKNWAIVFDTVNNRYFLCDDWGADGNWTGTDDETGNGDNSIVSRYCMDGSLLNADPKSCAQRGSGIVLGNGDATISVSGGTIPADKISYVPNRLTFNAQGVGTGGYVYLQHEKATTSFAVGTLTSGVVRVLKSAKGASKYVQ